MLNLGSNPINVENKGSTPLHDDCCLERKTFVAVLINQGRQDKDSLVFSSQPAAPPLVRFMGVIYEAILFS